MPFVAKFLQGETVDFGSARMFGEERAEHPSFSTPVHYVDEYGRRNPVSDAAAGSVLLMDIIGGVTKYDTWCGPSGTLTKANLIQSAVDNPNISGIVLNIDTPGGEASAVELISRTIREGKAKKPIIAYVHGYCASAGYWIASNCTEIIMDGEISMIGSIGVYQRLMDFSKRFEQMGVSIKDYYSTLSPKKNEEYRAWLAGDDKPLINTLDRLAQTFQDTVKTNRPGITDEDAFKGRMYFTKEAVDNGMADRAGSMADAIEAATVPITQVTSNNTYMKKIQIGAAFTGLLAFFSAKPKDGETFAEADWTEEKQKDLNTKLERLATVETELQAAQTELAAEKVKVTNLTTEKNELQAKVDKLPAGASTVAEVKTEQPVATNNAAAGYVDANADHNQMAAAAGL